MKQCVNCHGAGRDTDIYCRNCGIRLKKSWYYVVINICSVLFGVAFVFMVLLFIASYLVY